MIRQAKATDVPRLVEICRAYHPRSHWAPVSFNVEKATSRFTDWIDNENVLVLIGDNSLLVGCATEPWFSDDTITQELLFYAADKAGIALRDTFEAWARGQDTVLNLMSAQEPGPAEVMTRWYRRAGYRPFGRSFAKEL